MIWSPDDVFSAGADLEALMPVFMKSGAKGIAPEEKKLQDAMLRVRYAQRAGGGGDARHRAGRRLRAGGLLRARASRRWKATSAWSKSASAWCPGGGGLAYIARRAAEMAAAGNAERRPAARS